MSSHASVNGIVRRITSSLSTGAVVAAAAVALGAAPAAAQPITDAAGDFLATYTGPRNGDLDVLTAGVTFNGTTFRFTSTQNGAVGTTPTGFYVWGVNRGQGTARFGAIAPGVLFDAVVILRPDLTAAITDFVDPTRSVANLPGAVSVNGATITGLVAASALVSTGFAPSAYTFNLWPRVPGTDPALAIADFAPNNSNVFATNVVPEPGTWMLLGTGLTALGAVARRRRVKG